MNRVLAGRNFDFDRDVAVYVYRWGHSMVYPKPGWPFGAAINKNGQVIRVPSARFYARQQIGRISFGAQDVSQARQMKARWEREFAPAAKCCRCYS